MDREEIDALAEKCHHGYSEWNIDLYRFAYLVAAAERERAAKVCEDEEVHDVGHPGTAFAVQGMCAAAIRALT